MKLKSNNSSTTIANYVPIFIPCYYQDNLHLAIRSYTQNGLGYFLLVEPYSLVTCIVLKGDIQHRKINVSPTEIGYYTKSEIDETPYGRILKQSSESTYPITNAGITHSQQQHKTNEIFLTIDLCPSKKVFEKSFFDVLVSQDKAIPITICITEFWYTLHQEEFHWLLEQQRLGKLLITWANHSASHIYYSDCTAPNRLEENFLLDKRTNLTYELFEIEKTLIMHGQLPSVFFRAPGLITNKALNDYINRIGLILLGADAWLAKGQKPQSGSIILVHGNANEPQGIELFMDYFKKQEPTCLPIYHAFFDPSIVLNPVGHNPYISAPINNSKHDEETDDEAEKELILETKTDDTRYWQKSPNAMPGKRMLYLENASERLALFRKLKAKDYDVKQCLNEEKIQLNVQLPTI